MAAWGRLAGGGLTCFSSAVQLCARYWLLPSTKASHQRGIFCFPLTVTLDTKAAAEGPSPGAGTAGIILQGREGRAEAEGQGRSAPGMHNLEPPEPAKGLLLGPPSPPARNLSRTLGDRGNRPMVSWSNSQLTASVPGLESGGRRGPRALYPRMWPCCVQLATAVPQHVCGFLCNEKLHWDNEQGDSSWSSTREVKTLSRFCPLQGMCAPFPVQTRNSAKPQCKILPGPQLCPQLCCWLTQLNSSFTPKQKSEQICQS